MIRLENVDYRYKRKAPVLESVSLNIPSGGVTGVLGLNGVGKTTLFKLLAGLLVPQSGSVRVLDHVPRDREVDFLGKLFFVPDEFGFETNVSADTFARQFGALYPRFDYTLFSRFMDAFSVDPSSRIGTASLGQQRKTLLSLGFATQPRFMLLDEPLSGLDIPSRSVFRDILIDQITDDKHFLISTHEVRELPAVFDGLYMLGLNQSAYVGLSDVREKFSQVVSPKALPHAFYTEASALGFLSLISRRAADENEPDIELLFRAFNENPSALQSAVEDGARSTVRRREVQR